jgi:hypothetical protein
MHAKQALGGFRRFQFTSPQADICNTRMESYNKGTLLFEDVVVPPLPQVSAEKHSEGGEVSREEAAWLRKAVQVEAVEVLADLDARDMPEISSRGAVQEDVRRRFRARGAYLVCAIRNDAFLGRFARVWSLSLEASHRYNLTRGGALLFQTKLSMCESS